MKGEARPGTERRQFPRVMPAGAGPAQVRLRPGREALVVNLSLGGVLVEGLTPLRPGSPVELRVTLPGWEWQGQAQVVRCQVSALPRGQKVRYRAGLQFSAPVATCAKKEWSGLQVDRASSSYPAGSVETAPVSSDYP